MLRADIPVTDPCQFDAFFAQIVKEKRAYLTVGAVSDFESRARRLIPFFANSELATIDGRDVRKRLALMREDVEAGVLSAKTVNNRREAAGGRDATSCPRERGAEASGSPDRPPSVGYATSRRWRRLDGATFGTASRPGRRRVDGRAGAGRRRGGVRGMTRRRTSPGMAARDGALRAGRWPPEPGPRGTHGRPGRVVFEASGSGVWGGRTQAVALPLPLNIAGSFRP